MMASGVGNRFRLCIAIPTAFIGYMSLGQAIADDGESKQPVDREAISFFESNIRPLLVDNCYERHGPDAQESGLRVDSRGALIQGGEIGFAMLPGKPNESLLIDAVKHGDVVKMPPERKLSRQQISDLTKWVEICAPWPGDDAAPADHKRRQQGFQITDEDRRFWSFKAIADPQVPHVRSPEWCTGDVDRFVLAKLEANNLKPSAEADKHTLLRRVTFDLTGLPPTLEEIEAFIDDTSPRAYEKVVERLLDSPRYGEQQGRHWLDVVRFAESAGHDSDWAYRLAWRYRDYVIDAPVPFKKPLQFAGTGNLMKSLWKFQQHGQSGTPVSSLFPHLVTQGKEMASIGRDHNPYGFTMWMAGGGIKPGITHGATDEFGYFAVENICTIYDLHATILHLLGLDHERLTYRHAGRDFRLTDVHGRVVHEIHA